jgi:hypothetical protein
MSWQTRDITPKNGHADCMPLKYTHVVLQAGQYFSSTSGYFFIDKETKIPLISNEGQCEIWRL